MKKRSMILAGILSASMLMSMGDMAAYAEETAPTLTIAGETTEDAAEEAKKPGAPDGAFKPAQPETDENGKPVQPETDENGKPIQPETDEDGKPVQPETDEDGKSVQPETDENGKPVQPGADENGRINPPGNMDIPSGNRNPAGRSNGRMPQDNNGQMLQNNMGQMPGGGRRQQRNNMGQMPQMNGQAPQNNMGQMPWSGPGGQA